VIVGLDHLAIKVSDGDRAAAFYRDVLGAVVDALPYGRLRFRVGGVAIHVHPLDATPHPLPRNVPGPGSADLCFRWSGTADEAADYLRGRGVEPILEGASRSGADGEGKSVYFHDPDGSLLELIAYA
jgi:catechol 2,3-dioxygenase-like lactoylglutathione lyase family enzyme